MLSINWTSTHKRCLSRVTPGPSGAHSTELQTKANKHATASPARQRSHSSAGGPTNKEERRTCAAALAEPPSLTVKAGRSRSSLKTIMPESCPAASNECSCHSHARPSAPRENAERV
eukprot:219256-Rhodomonas_salina.2